eukprot:PhM_4_TR8009/c0_g1_i1/m.54634/K10752/RBBP4, HAT2, CAF1, MIS16; histone-binding protein RBBP4
MSVDDFLHRRHLEWAQRAQNLYSFLGCHVLETPSLTVEWIPDSKRDIPNKGYSAQNLMLGTYYVDLPNYLTTHTAFLPREWDEVLYEETTYEDDATFSAYPDTVGEAGRTIYPYKAVTHDGEVNTAKIMPQRPSIAATRGPHAQVHVFDFARRRAEPEDHNNVRPDARLKGPRKEGFALAWCPCNEGFIASGGGDMIVYVWDLAGNATMDRLGAEATIDVAPLYQFTSHTDTVESVSWHPTHSNVLASASSDKTCIFWDTRTRRPQQKEEVHLEAVYNVTFHPTGVFLLATTSADKTVRIWDMRKMRKPVYELVGHTSDVYGMKWSPFSDTVLASHSRDGTVALWDMARINLEPDDVQDAHAPPAQVFRHYGHLDTVRDVAWNPHEGDEWMLASVDDANMLQIWRPTPDCYTEGDLNEVFNGM